MPPRPKSPAVPDEHTRLINDAPPSYTHIDSAATEPAEPPAPSRRPRARLVIISLAVAGVVFLLGGLIFAALVAASFRPTPSELEVLPKTAFEYTAPSSISIVDISDQGVLLNITLPCGIDADQAFGVQGFYLESDRQQAKSRGWRGTGSEWWENVRRKGAHWAVRTVGDRVSVDLKDGILVFPTGADAPEPLGYVELPERVVVPLITGVPAYHPEHPDLSWLEPVSFIALAKPVANTGDIWEFIRKGWVKGSLDVVIGIREIEAHLAQGEHSWWGTWATVEEQDLAFDVSLPIPIVPHLPRPRHDIDLSSLVTLHNYTLSNEHDSDLTITAMATMPNFVRHLNLSDSMSTMPFGLPFSISLPDANGDEKMAEVILEPVTIGAEKNITLTIAGKVTADLDSAQLLGETSSLSLFLQNYLHGLSSPIIVHGLSSFPYKTQIPKPPAWLLHTLPSLSLNLSFPGPSPPPQIIKSVTIEKMTIEEEDGKMKASGIVVAEVELPGEMAAVGVVVNGVKPNVLVYDGPAPPDGEDDIPDGEEYPLKAFGHINPPEYLPSTTTPSTDPATPHRLIVRAPLTNVDLDILPGRDSVLSDFVTKVVFKGGAVAGVKGVSAVKVDVRGVGGHVEVDGLPVRGEFFVGKQRG
ncbi:hypothetical protein L202_00372 [Cryptococcus amylolentus CBS 6039]|uniref:Uncharacterized protein n=2 Tax=Cryptococcus amylolentus TaxID=104669 RepID=A0A1E3I7E6_9TREE|nr:hypothetical protein L202_00372 [Cryptococcus amylolentus CBS 6039]ODN84418.1 hypothetical protein L202_00372 [Cryptococcus amylolentus CBS 6039]ODO11774.1 hypothetical protein I350_00558 [Cryptococcus amylolentus CBS 6273]